MEKEPEVLNSDDALKVVIHKDSNVDDLTIKLNVINV